MDTSDLAVLSPKSLTYLGKPFQIWHVFDCLASILFKVRGNVDENRDAKPILVLMYCWSKLFARNLNQVPNMMTIVFNLEVANTSYAMVLLGTTSPEGEIKGACNNQRRAWYIQNYGGIPVRPSGETILDREGKSLGQGVGSCGELNSMAALAE